MSLNKIKAKENKGKQKALPKLKAILANPTKTRCPVLDETELEHLKFLLKSLIEDSNLEPIAFATKNGICLGLESSLRKINNQGSSCVFISLGIKPNYIVNLIARNAQTKDEKQPVFAQPKLENFIQEIFGIQALCMVFPKDLSSIGEKLNDWVKKRQKQDKNINISLTTNKTIKKKIKKTKAGKPALLESCTTKSDQIKEEIETKSKKLTKGWCGDYISFGNKLEKDISKLDGEEAVDALAEIIDKIPTTTKTLTKVEENCEPMEVDSDLPAVKQNVDDTDSDDFLGEYKALTVHKIKGNPNKNPKKKRKKNKKKKLIKK